jgi:hypothetical protein
MQKLGRAEWSLCGPQRTCVNRSPASSHLLLELPNHPTVDPAFFSALARSSSAFDLAMLYVDAMDGCMKKGGRGVAL